MELPKRKRNRLKEFDYRTPGAYFITICTMDRKNLFWTDLNTVIHDPKKLPLSQYGIMADRAVKEINNHYPSASVDIYSVMPNHVHLLIQLHCTCSDSNTPTITEIVRQLKGTVSKQAGFSVWQKGYYDHVIRNEADYQQIYRYIEGNPLKWEENP